MSEEEHEKRMEAILKMQQDSLTKTIELSKNIRNQFMELNIRVNAIEKWIETKEGA